MPPQSFAAYGIELPKIKMVLTSIFVTFMFILNIRTLRSITR
jgi:hypothetical protein